MPQDAFSLYHTTKELEKIIKNARVDKVNQPDNDTVVLSIRALNQNLKLILCANAQNTRVCLTKKESKNPLTAPNFCMLLRKHLSHATIKDIELLGFERIIKITFECKNELWEITDKIIYSEIMGKFSNIILVENGVILGALKQSTLDESNLRPIFSGLKYTLPISQEKVEITDEKASLDMLEKFNGCDLENFIFTNFKGIAKSTAVEIVHSFKIKNSLDDDFVKNLNIIEFYKHFKNFYVSPKINPNLTNTKSGSDFYITDYKSVLGEKIYFDSILDCIDHHFTKKEEKKLFDSKKTKLLQVISAFDKKLRKKHQLLLERELSCKDMEQNRLYGELIISNLYQLKSPTDKVCLIDYSKEDCPTVEIKLDKTITPKENADKFFKKYAKQKKTLTATREFIEENQQLLDYVSTLFKELEDAESLSDFADIEEELTLNGIIKPKKGTKQKEQPSKPRRYEYLGFEILVGRNNLQNDRLTLSSERNDMFLHTKDYHSAHVIIKSMGREIPDKVIEYAAEICAYYSKAKNSDKVPVDYTLRKFVKKPNGLKTGMVIYTNHKTILVTPNPHF